MRKPQALRSRIAIVTCISIISLSGCGKGSKKNVPIDGVVGPNVNFVDNKLTLSVVLQNLQIDYGVRIPIPKMPNSYLEVGPDLQSNGYMIHFGVDAGDIKQLAGDGVNLLPPTLLPGGRPLPGVIDGQLPGMALEVPRWHHLVFYAGADVFGVFIPVNLPKFTQNFIASSRFYDGAGDPIGTLSIVGRDDRGENAGFLLLINLRGKVGQLIQM